MTRLSVWMLGVALFLGALPIAARAYWQPPHFSDPPVSADCFQCHISSPHHGLASYPSALKELCENCHFDGGPAAAVLTHSSRTTDNGYGNWDLDCWSCHNQHAQEQEEYWPLDPSTYGKYIRRYFERTTKIYGQIKEIDPLDPGPYYEPLSIIREVTSTIVEFKGPAWFVDGDGLADDDICQVCHLQTLYYNTGTEKNFHADYGTDSQPGGDCTSCHRHEDGFVASSGHSGSDFAWTTTTQTSCGSASCHDWSSNTNVVADVHNDICLNCHNNAWGGNGTTVDRDVGFATNGSTTTPHTDECTVCHTLINGHTHHDRSNSYAANSTCSQCHIDPRVAAGYARQAQIKQLSCRACHVRKNGTTLEVVAISYAKAGSAATGDDSGNTYTAITIPNGFDADHTFANTNATDETDAIDNYGICFECHGATGRTGYGTATNPLPYHAMPQAGPYNAGVNTIGGDGWQGNMNTGDGSTFRGGLDWDAVALDAYYPIGKGKLNLAYAQHSLAKGATNNMTYRTQTQSAVDIYATIAPALVYGTQIVEHDSSTLYFVPHFDSICTGGSGTPCDNITGASVTELKDGGTTTGFRVTATSSTGATLHVIYGGVEVGSFTSGGNFDFIYRDDKNAAIDQYYCMDQFNADNASPVWLVSEAGGAANAGNSYTRNPTVNDTASGSPTCTRVTW